jgi:hypothetical protein
VILIELVEHSRFVWRCSSKFGSSDKIEKAGDFFFAKTRFTEQHFENENKARAEEPLAHLTEHRDDLRPSCVLRAIADHRFQTRHLALAPADSSLALSPASAASLSGSAISIASLASSRLTSRVQSVYMNRSHALLVQGP